MENHEKLVANVVHAAGMLLFTGSGEPNENFQPGKFLLMRHADRWDLPKGHCEPGETDWETATRETEEETGITNRQVDRIGDFMFTIQYAVTYRDALSIKRKKRVTYFLGRVVLGQEIHCTEHLGYQWFDWQPPHQIQAQTIDPLLAAAAAFFRREQER